MIFFCISDLENMTMLHRYTNASCALTDDSMTSIVFWNVPCALCNPNGIEINRHSPWCKVQAVLTRSYLSISTCMYLLFASDVQNTFIMSIELIDLFIRGNGTSLVFQGLQVFCSQHRIVAFHLFLVQRLWVLLISPAVLLQPFFIHILDFDCFKL